MKSLLQKLVLLIVALTTLYSCCDCPSGTPNIIVDAEVAQEMKALYLDNQHNYINTALDSLYPGSSPDFTDVSYPIEELQKYLSLIKKDAKENGYEEVGVRIYFGTKLVEGVPKSSLVFAPITPEEGEGEGNEDPDPDTSLWGEIPDGINADMGDVGNNNNG